MVLQKDAVHRILRGSRKSLEVRYANSGGTLSTCPRCGSKPRDRGSGALQCPNCGFVSQARAIVYKSSHTKDDMEKIVSPVGLFKGYNDEMYEVVRKTSE